MADELLDELKTYCLCGHVDYDWYYFVGGKGCPLCQAAAEIKRLRAEVARLGAFLHPIGEQARRG